MLRDICRVIAVTSLLLATPAWAEGELSLAAVRIDGAEAKEAPGVLRKAAGEARAQPVTLRVGEAIAEGVEVTAPPRVRLELASRHGNRITLNPGARLLVGRVAERGEAHALQAGEASFSVKKALDFYQVSYKRFLATVRGTEYSIRVDGEKEIAFAVAEGEVEVERTGKVRVAVTDDAREADSVREAERLPAGTVKAYALDVDEYLRTFNSYADAEVYYRGALQKALDSGDEADIRRARSNLGVVLATFSRYEDARREFEAGLVLARKRFGEADNADVAAFIRHIGMTHLGLNEYAKAQAEFERAFAMHRRLARSEEDDFTARLYSSVGMLALQVNDFPKAIDNLTHASAIMARSGGKPDRRLRFGVLDNLGFAQFRAAEYAQSQRTYQQALALQQELDGERDSLTRLAVLDNLAFASLRGSDYRTALATYEQSLAMARRLYGGRDQEQVAITLRNLAATYSALSQFPKAAEHLAEAAAMAKRLFGERDHRLTMSILNSLGAAYLRSSEYEKAIQALQEALAMARRIYPGDNTEIATMLVNLGGANMAVARHAKALEALRESEEMQERLLAGRDTDARAYVLLQLAGVYALMGEPRKSESYAQRALTMVRGLHPGKDHAMAAGAMMLIGSAQYAGTKFHEARDTFAAAAAMRERIVGSGDSVEMVDSLTMLASAHMILGSMKDAIAPLEKAQAMARRLHGNKDNAQLAVVLYQLGLGYAAGGDSGRALASLEESVAMLRRLLGSGDHEKLALAQGFLSLAYMKDGQLERAVESTTAARDMLDRLYKGKDPHPFSVLMALFEAEALSAAGRYRESQAALTRARELSGRVDPSGASLWSASIDMSEGELRFRMGRLEEGHEQLSRGVRRLREMLRTDENDSMVGALLVRGAIQAERGELRAAQGDFDRAYAIAQALQPGKDTSGVAQVMMAQAVVKAYRGEFQDARDTMTKSLEMHRRLAGGRPSRDVAAALASIAEMQAQMGQDEAALRFLEEAESAAATIPEHPRKRVRAMLDMTHGRLHMEKRDYAAAATSFDAAVSERRVQQREAPGIELAYALAALASAQALRGDAARAAALVDEAETIRTRILGARDHPLATSLLEARARIAQASRDSARAVALWEQAIAMSQRIHGTKPRASYVEAMKGLSGMLAEGGRADEARNWKERADAMRRDLLASR